MKLYHGTSEYHAERVLREGLAPRAAHGMSCWGHSSSSRADCGYLTTAYPLYFSVWAANCIGKEACGRLAVLEVDVDLLDDGRLLPDEDVLEQLGRGRDGLSETLTMAERAMHYRERLPEFAGSHKTSLDAMGTCAYRGTIPVSALTRVAYLDHSVPGAAHIAVAAMDASITLANYRFNGDQHRGITAWLFGNVFESSETGRLMFGDMLAQMARHPRDGVELVRMTSEYEKVAFAGRP